MKKGKDAIIKVHMIEYNCQVVHCADQETNETKCLFFMFLTTFWTLLTMEDVKYDELDRAIDKDKKEKSIEWQ